MSHSSSRVLNSKKEASPKGGMGHFPIPTLCKIIPERGFHFPEHREFYIHDFLDGHIYFEAHAAKRPSYARLPSIEAGHVKTIASPNRDPIKRIADLEEAPDPFRELPDLSQRANFATVRSKTGERSMSNNRAGSSSVRSSGASADARNHRMIQETALADIASTLRTQQATIARLENAVANNNAAGAAATPSGPRKRLSRAERPSKQELTTLNDDGTSADPESALTLSSAVIKAKARPNVKQNGELQTLKTGDLICLRLSDSVSGTHEVGIVTADSIMLRAGVAETKHLDKGLRIEYESCIFRVCSKLNYRAQADMVAYKEDRDRKSEINSVAEVSDADEELMHMVEQRFANEVKQNEETLLKDREHDSEHLKYGEVYQFQHLATGKYLGMKMSPASVNTSCQKVGLFDGSDACHFRVMPRFKMRSVGFAVLADDEVVLESVSMTGFAMSAHNSFAYAQAPGNDNLGHYTPTRALRTPRTLEVNGAIVDTSTSAQKSSGHMSSFALKFYGRYDEDKELTTLNSFRMYHPERDAYFRASNNPDKGEVLDCLPSEHGGETVKKSVRRTKSSSTVPAHIPYLKPINMRDAADSGHMSSKSVWSFEPLEDGSAASIKWRTPYRIQHTCSEKFLSVDTSSPCRVDEDGTQWFDIALCSFDPNWEASGKKDGMFGTPASFLFTLVPVNVQGDTLPNAKTAARIEHVIAGTKSKTPLYFSSMTEQKPAYTDSTKKNRAPVGRVCFTTKPANHEVFKIMPIIDMESNAINRMRSYIPYLKLYAFRWMVEAEPPLDMCETLIEVCLQLLDDLIKGGTGPRRHKNILDQANEAMSTMPLAFSEFFGGDPNAKNQKLALDMKLMDAVFEATLAPYNRFRQAHPFDAPPGSGMPKAVQKFLFVVLQRLCHGNKQALLYISKQTIRTWQSAEAIAKPVPPAAPAAVAAASDIRPKVNGDGAAVTYDEEKQLYYCGRSFGLGEKGAGAGGDSVGVCLDYANGFRCSACKTLTANGGSDQTALLKATFDDETRTSTLWLECLIAQGEDPTGATVTLGKLFSASQLILDKVFGPELLARFVSLVLKCGPEPRLVALFKCICFVEGRPVRANQEQCVRSMWMVEEDRYKVGATFHEVDTADAWKALKAFKPVHGDSVSHVPVANFPAAPKAFLGRNEANVYGPVCVVWKPPPAGAKWKRGGSTGGFYFSPKDLRIPTCGTDFTMASTGEVVGDLVNVEHLMWVLDPARLCEPVTGQTWAEFQTERLVTKGKRAAKVSRAEMAAKAESDAMFRAWSQLAKYVEEQISYLAAMCMGRSYNSIMWLEKSFSYVVLMNMCTNPWLPYTTRATVMQLVFALYVDRFPQIPKCDDQSLPEQLWVLNSTGADQGGLGAIGVVAEGVKVSQDPFPAFAITPSCSVYSSPDPVLSHPDHFKFFLLRTLCNFEMAANKQVVHMAEGVNAITETMLVGQEKLLLYGFQSTYTKLKQLCKPYRLLLDGRYDALSVSAKGKYKFFDPPKQRYMAAGKFSASVTRIRSTILSILRGISLLRSNYQLQLLLSVFKARERKNDLGYLCGEKEDEVFKDFEQLFGGMGSNGAAAQLDLKELCDNPLLEHALVDCLMYDDDSLMASSLRLLESNYADRRTLRNALRKVNLLEDVRVNGRSAQELRSELTEMVMLVRTASTWGVRSKISGDFSVASFSMLMHMVVNVLDFVHGNWAKSDVFNKEAALKATMDGESSSTSSPLMGGPGTRGTNNGAVAASSATKSNKKGTSPHVGSSGKSPPPRGMSLDRVVDAPLCLAAKAGEYTWMTSVSDVWTRAKDDASAAEATAAASGKATTGEPFFGSCSPAAVTYHQNTLAASAFQQILDQGIYVDTEIAFKGSKCTDAERWESRRLLTMVLQGLLCSFEAFVNNNPAEQEVMFANLDQVAKLATAQPPVEPKSDGSVAVPNRDPQTLVLARNVLLALLRGNEANVGNLNLGSEPHPLFDLFSGLVEAAEQPWACPELEFFFITARPVFRPSRDFQNYATAMVVDAVEKPRLFECARKCVRASSRPLTQPGPGPYRMVRLLRTLMVNGNVYAATAISQATAIDVDALCASLVTYTTSLTVGSATGSPMATSKSSKRDSIARSAQNVQILHALRPCKTLSFGGVRHPAAGHVGGGFDLLQLLVEMMSLLPLSHRQLASKEIWGLFEMVLLPCLEATAHATTPPSVADQAVLTELVDLLHAFLSTAASLGLVATLRSGDVSNANVMDGLREALDVLFVKHRHVFPARIQEAVNRIETMLDESSELQDLGAPKFNRNDEFLLSTVVASSPNSPGGGGGPVGGLDNAVLGGQANAFAKGTLSFEDKFAKFQRSVETNQLIDRSLEARFLQMVARLEDGTPAFKKTSENGDSDALMWGDVLARFHTYVKNNFQATGEPREVCTLVLEILRHHLLKARTLTLAESQIFLKSLDGAPGLPATKKFESIDVDNLGDAERADFVAKQAFLAEAGLVELIAYVLLHFEAGEERELTDPALLLLNEMLLGGNEITQARLYAYLTEEDIEGKFLQHLAGRLEMGIRGITEAKNMELLGRGDAALTEECKSAMEVVSTLLEFMTQACEGHNHVFQEWVREQNMYAASTNLLRMSMELFNLMCDSELSVTHAGSFERSLLRQLLSFFVEGMQGPCVGNQLLLVRSDTVQCINFLIGTINEEEQQDELDDPEYMNMKGVACLCLSACLEGSLDGAQREEVRKRIELIPLEQLAVNLEKSLSIVRQRAQRAMRLLNESEAARFAVGAEVLVAVRDVQRSLGYEEHVGGLLVGEDRSQGTPEEREHNDTRLLREKKERREQFTSTVEILWHGRTHRACFPIPFQAAYFASAKKSEFLSNVPIETKDDRVKGLMKASNRLVSEMDWICAVAEQSWLYRTVHMNITNIKLCMYALVVLLNVNVLMSSKALESPYNAFFNDFDDLSGGEKTSLYLTLALGLTNFVGYLIIVVYLGITEVPIIIRETRARADQQMELMKPSEYKDFGAFSFWGVTLVMNVMFIVMHFANYSDQPNYPLYYFLIFGINMPWTLSCVRNYIVVPTNSFERTLCITYDTAITKPFFRNHIVLQFFSIQGFLSSEYFTLMLLDIFNNSETLAAILQSATAEARRLGLVFYTIVITMVIVATFVQVYYSEYLTIEHVKEDGSVNEKSCATVISCFWLLFRSPGGDFGLSIPNPGHPDYMWRVFFDMGLQVWLGSILSNIITGLLVDSFGALREARNNRDAILANQCFMCGLSREDYEDFGLESSAPNFDEHKDEHHMLWTYVFFLSHLRKKAPTTFTGVESYVASMTLPGMAASLDWIPARSSYDLEERGITGVAAKEGDDSDDEDGAKSLQDEVRAISEVVKRLEEQMADL